MQKEFPLLLVLTLNLAVSGCQFSPRDSPERIEEAKQEVLRLGGKIEENGVDGSIISISLKACDVSEAKWEKMLPLKGLLRLQLDATATSDEDLRHLKGCTRLTYLEMAFTDVTDKGLESLVDFPRLELLMLNGCRITDNAAKTLPKIGKFPVVAMCDTYITEKGIEEARGKIDTPWNLWSTVQSDEVFAARTVLERSGIHTSSTSALKRHGTVDRMGYDVYLSPTVKIDEEHLKNTVQTLAQAGDLSITYDGDRFLSLLPQIEPIKEIHIHLADKDTPFDKSQLDSISQAKAERVQVTVPGLPSETLKSLTKVGGMNYLEIHEQTITPGIWQAFLDAEGLETIALFSCNYRDIEIFPRAQRKLQVKFSGAETAPESVQEEILELVRQK